MSDLRPAALCCRHCPDDPVHDVPKDGHDVPCPTCERESDAYQPGQRDLAAKVEALAEEWMRKAADLAPEDDWGESVGSTIAADFYRITAAELRNTEGMAQ